MLSNAPRDPNKLTKSEERALQEELRKRAYRHCDIVVKPWVDCFKEAKLAAPFTCRALQRRMEDCIHNFDTEKAKAEITAEFIAARTSQTDSARRKKEEEQRKRDEKIRLIVEDERRRRREAAKGKEKEIEGK